MKRALFFLGIILFSFSSISASDNKDNKAKLDELKASTAFQIEQNQALMNTNLNGSVTDKGLNAKWFNREVTRQFNKMAKGMNWRTRDLIGNYDISQLGEVLSIYLAASRIVIDRSQDKINTDDDGTENPKNFGPCYFGRLAAEDFKNKTGIDIKQTTSGFIAKDNTSFDNPDSWEKKALRKIETSEWERRKGFGEKVTEGGQNYYRFMFPLDKGKDADLFDIEGGISIRIAMN
jgi:hypothetical protein